MPTQTLSLIQRCVGKKDDACVYMQHICSEGYIHAPSASGVIVCISDCQSASVLQYRLYTFLNDVRYSSSATSQLQAFAHSARRRSLGRVRSGRRSAAAAAAAGVSPVTPYDATLLSAAAARPPCTRRRGRGGAVRQRDVLDVAALPRPGLLRRRRRRRQLRAFQPRRPRLRNRASPGPRARPALHALRSRRGYGRHWRRRRDSRARDHRIIRPPSSASSCSCSRSCGGGIGGGGGGIGSHGLLERRHQLGLLGALLQLPARPARRPPEPLPLTSNSSSTFRLHLSTFCGICWVDTWAAVVSVLM